MERRDHAQVNNVAQIRKGLAVGIAAPFANIGVEVIQAAESAERRADFRRPAIRAVSGGEGPSQAFSCSGASI